jgi:hypothetical protein
LRGAHAREHFLLGLTPVLALEPGAEPALLSFCVISGSSIGNGFCCSLGRMASLVLQVRACSRVMLRRVNGPAVDAR